MRMSLMTYRVLVSTCLVLGSACSKSDTSSGGPSSTPPPASIRTFVTPDDLMTGVASTPIMVSFSDTPDDASLEMIRSSLLLETYPSATPVAFSATVSTTPQAGTPTGGGASVVQKFISVTPQSPLAAQWYALVIPSFPSTVGPGNSIDKPATSQAAQIARFNPNSAPVVRQIKLLSKGRVEFLFSEGVVIDPTSIGSILQVTASDGSTCALVPVAPGTARPYTVADFSCAASALASMKIHVTLNAGLASVSGVPLGVVQSGTCPSVSSSSNYSADLDFTNASSCSTGCRGLTPTTPSSCTDSRPR